MTCSSENRHGGLLLIWVALAGVMPAAPATFATHIAPVLEEHCTVCHGEKKQKAGLRLDSFAHLLAGSDDQDVVKAGDPGHSELFRRITLPAGHDDVMPSDGKPLLSAHEITLLENWITAGATESATFAVPETVEPVTLPPAAPDYRPRIAAATALAHSLGVKLVPRSTVPTDGLVLRTASAPARCTDAVLAQLAPFADLIVEAELARTAVTDVGLAALAGCSNLQVIDLSQTAVSTHGMTALASLPRLASLNLTETAVDAEGVATLRSLPALRQLWYFGTPAQTNTELDHRAGLLPQPN